MRVLTSYWFLPAAAALTYTGLDGSLAVVLHKYCPPHYLAMAKESMREANLLAMHILHKLTHYAPYMLGIAFVVPIAFLGFCLYR